MYALLIFLERVKKKQNTFGKKCYLYYQNYKLFFCGFCQPCDLFPVTITQLDHNCLCSLLALITLHSTLHIENT